MRRILYFGYYLMKLDRKAFIKFLVFTKEKTKKSTISIIRDIIKSCFKYNISILEYFQFHFFELDENGRKQWAGTGYMYEYHKLMNPPKYRYLLEDKTSFYREYKKYMKHIVADISDLQSNQELIERLLKNKSGKIVFKIKDGGCGERVLVKSTSEFESISIIPFMHANQYDLVEEFIIQHSVINTLAPTAVNTVRIITQINKNNDVVILGCRLRISVGGFVDNLAAGNIAAPIDTETGIINGNAVYSDITKNDTDVHPVTKIKFNGIQIPYWEETINLVKDAAKVSIRNRSVGWDVAITLDGPDLIEGNREWCKLLYQLPVKKGLKSDLDYHLFEYKNIKI